MSARKSVEEGCNGGLLCPVEGHVSGRYVGKGTMRWSHIPLTRGQEETIWERQQAEREAQR